MLEDTRGLLPALDGSVIVVTLIGSRYDRRGLQAMPYNVECREFSSTWRLACVAIEVASEIVG
jgi:hypothetical protein